MKTQLIRLVDVFALGPFMIYAAQRAQLTRTERNTLTIIGLLTIAYNLKNYLETREQESPTSRETV
jgi:hypothetical protein